MRPTKCLLANLSVWLIAAASPTLCGAPHPADSNADQTISLDEISAYAAAWKTGSVWPAGPSPIPADYYQQAVFIWKNGESYREAADAAAPYKWVPDPGGNIIYLPATSLSAQPFDLITVAGIDPTLDLVATFTIENESGVFQTLWNPVGETATLEIQVPLNPYTFSGEGVVHFTLSDEAGGTSWKLQPIQLAALPPAPGATQSMLGNFASRYQDVAADFNHSLQDSDAYDIGNVPQAARPLVYMNAWLRHPDNPGSLANLVGALDSESIDLCDRIFAKVIPGAAPVAEAASAGIPIAAASTGTGNEFLEIGNAFELAQAMAAQKTAQTSVVDKFSPRDAANDLLNLQGNASAAEGIFKTLKGVKTPSSAPGILSAISVTLMVADFFDHFDAGNLPSRFTALDLAVDGPARGYFLEDKSGCDTATITATATAASTGFDMLKTLGEVAPGGTLGRPGIKDGFRWTDQLFPELDQLDLPPYVWSGISVGGDLYSETFVDDKFTLGGYNAGKVGMDFKPAKAGVGLLTVTVSASQFSGNTITEETQYQTAPIQVEILFPQQVVTGDEDFVTYQAKLSDAYQIGPADLEWRASAGTVTNPRSLGGGSYEMDWVPSQNEADYPVTITATSKTKECARAAATDEREDSIQVDLDSWEILPAVACIDKGDTLTFFAESTSGDPFEATWSVVSGNGVIDSFTGEFTAGTTPGPVVIRATPAGPGAAGDPKDVSFKVGCTLTVSWMLDPADAPDQPATVHPRMGGFFLADESGTTTDAISSDLFVEYETITPPAAGQLVGTVSGSYTGAGLYQSSDQQLMGSLVNDSGALRTYTATDVFGSPYEYTVEAGFSEIQFENSERVVNLLGGPDGTLMEMRLDAGVSSSGALDSEIVSYTWFFSDGGQAVGEVVTPSFDRQTARFTARLVVMDSFGNSAEYIQTFLIVEFSGFFNFPYAPDTTQVNSIFSSFSIPPMIAGDGIVEFTTDPNRCNIALFMDGAKSATASTKSSICGLVNEDEVPGYIIGFGGSTSP